MAIVDFRINPAGGPIEVDVLFGQAQYGEYTVKLYDANGRNGQTIGEGNNIDPIPDRFPVPGVPSELVGRVMSWRLEIGAPSGGPGQFYFARVTVIQDGGSVPDGPREYSGPLDDAKLILDIGRFVAAST